MFLVVGLGNPGPRYAGTRHNFGFLALDVLASHLRAESFREKFSGLVTKISLDSGEVVLLKPQTFMNLSGQSVRPAVTFFKVQVSQVIVLHDELDLPLGEMRIKLGGGHAGHNGLRSLLEHLGTPDFLRIRLGIGRPPPAYEVSDYVLSRFDGGDQPLISEVCHRAVSAVEDVMKLGSVAAMNRHNPRKK